MESEKGRTTSYSYMMRWSSITNGPIYDRSAIRRSDAVLAPLVLWPTCGVWTLDLGGFEALRMSRIDCLTFFKSNLTSVHSPFLSGSNRSFQQTIYCLSNALSSLLLNFGMVDLPSFLSLFLFLSRVENIKPKKGT